MRERTANEQQTMFSTSGIYDRTPRHVCRDRGSLWALTSLHPNQVVKSGAAGWAGRQSNELA